MPNPEDVNPHNFLVEEIIYNDGEFSIAWGVWEGTTKLIAMRWNGDADAGYPKTFGHPVWFVLPKNLSMDIIRGIIGNEHCKLAKISKVIVNIRD